MQVYILVVTWRTRENYAPTSPNDHPQLLSCLLLSELSGAEKASLSACCWYIAYVIDMLHLQDKNKTNNRR